MDHNRGAQTFSTEGQTDPGRLRAEPKIRNEITEFQSNFAKVKEDEDKKGLNCS